MNSPSVVVDASLTCLWAIPEEHTERAFILARTWAASNTRLLAPCLILAEVTNAVYKRILRKELDLIGAKRALQVILDFNIEIIEEPGLHERALELASKYKMSTTYDAHYLALAERYECALWTADKKLLHTVSDKLSWVNWVGGVARTKGEEAIE